MRRILPFLVVAALLLAATSVLAGPVPVRRAQISASYDQTWHVMASAGAPSNSSSFAANGTLTQFAIGPGQSSSYRVGHGYWYGIPVKQLPIGGLVAPASGGALLARLAGLALLVGASGAWLLGQHRDRGQLTRR